MKIATIIGARPQFIKAAPLSRALRALPGLQEIIIHSGQHYDHNMSEVFFEELEIPEPDYNLGIGSLSHGAQTGQMLEAMEKVLLHEKPEWVLVFGDTNSTLAGALAAVKIHIPTAHIEAGLRSYNRHMPEEINRILTDHASELLFAPTVAAVNNLLKEGINEDKIALVGDVMYDAALFYGEKAERVSHILERLKLIPQGYILVTVHRAENTDHPGRLQAIFDGLSKVGKDIPVICPLHPRTRSALQGYGMLDKYGDSIKVIDPVGYLEMVMLEKNARLITTDSGGVQKEAFFYRVPCVTLREETEWVELVKLGWNRVVSPENSRLVADGILSSLDRVGNEGQPYGNGQSAQNICQFIQKYQGRVEKEISI